MGGWAGSTIFGPTFEIWLNGQETKNTAQMGSVFAIKHPFELLGLAFSIPFSFQSF